MVHFNVPPPPPKPDVTLEKCQHAFVLIGHEAVFAVHMTQFWHEAHKFQLVFRLGLAPHVVDALRRERERHPDAAFVLCNAKDDAFAVPSLVTAPRAMFRGAIFHGIRVPPPDPMPEHFFPWSRDSVLPVIDDVTATVEHVVLFRPFSHLEPFPPHPIYLLWGLGEEAHMTRLQTARLLTGPFEAPLFGIDVDHVMSLAGRPDWLDADLMASGIVVSLPDVARCDAEGRPVITADPPFHPGDALTLFYRGLGPPRLGTAGTCWLWGGAVCNSPELAPVTPGTSLLLTEMPRQYWRT